MSKRDWFPKGYLSFCFLLIIFACGAGLLGEVYCSILGEISRPKPDPYIPAIMIGTIAFCAFAKLNKVSPDEKSTLNIVQICLLIGLILFGLIHVLF